MEGTDRDKDQVIRSTEDDELLEHLRLNMRDYCRNDSQDPTVIQDVLPREKNYRTEIQRVPEIMLLNVDLTQHFTPREFSIGPIHAGSPNMLQNRLKLQLAAHFILKSGKTEEFLFDKLKIEIKDDVKTYFKKDVIMQYEEDLLIRMLFLDGCAMLGFIHGYVNRMLNVFDISDGQAALIQQDLFLLENQIPFTVLDVLMGLGREWEKENLKDDFLIFIFLVSNITFPRDSLEHLHAYFDYHLSSKRKSHKPVHILDLLREVFLFDSWFSHIDSMLTVVCEIFCLLCCCGPVLISYVMKRSSKSLCLPTYLSKTKQSFRTVQELKAAGIKFKPSDSLTAISFHSHFFNTAKLMLPTLVVDDSTERKLFNLVAYEMCLSDSHLNREPWVTSYVKLLDLLVDSEQDVKDLRVADILRHSLSSDIDAAKLINSIGSKCSAPRQDAYVGVKKKIEKHYRRKCATWVAQAYHAHFRSPWTVLALFAATTILALTAIQTWYSMNPKK
ncbi:hypothetical protein TIFTF001_038447 [Ficus carica]|uniref:Uncharacterized protein n=1 Tax=Ficus carica TaxID=3494 RepID=A0AA88JD27_FICCA|nr:hypothetical protein TIFTF001_038447 [Ficus carica]